MGWLLITVVAALAARLVWELLFPLLPLLICLLIAGGTAWLMVSQIRRIR